MALTKQDHTLVAFPLMKASDMRYRSELLRNLAAQHEEVGEARGEGRGEARAVLTVLEARGVAVPAEIRDTILARTDLAQLDSWLRRATTATAPWHA